jgi:hypothetical protein
MRSTRELALDLLDAGNLSATAMAKQLGIDRNTVSHAVMRAHKAGEVRIVDYIRTGKDFAPVYALGGGVDAERPAPFDQSAYSAEYRAKYPERNRASSRAWSERNVEYVRAKQAEYRARRRAAATVQAPPVAPVPAWSRADETVRVRPIASQLSGLHTPAFDRKPAVTESALTYFEIPEMPGVQRFTCVKLRADLSVDSCCDRYQKAMTGGFRPFRYSYSRFLQLIQRCLPINRVAPRWQRPQIVIPKNRDSFGAS